MQRWSVPLESLFTAGGLNEAPEEALHYAQGVVGVPIRKLAKTRRPCRMIVVPPVKAAAGS
jgi:hypothetical protein